MQLKGKREGYENIGRENSTIYEEGRKRGGGGEEETDICEYDKVVRHRDHASEESRFRPPRKINGQKDFYILRH